MSSSATSAATSTTLQPFNYQISAKGNLPKGSRAEVQLTYQTSAAGFLVGLTGSHMGKQSIEIKQKGATSCQGGRIDGELFPNTLPTMSILYESPNGTRKTIPLQFGETTTTKLPFPERPNPFFADRGVSRVSISFVTDADNTSTQAIVAFDVEKSTREKAFHTAADAGDALGAAATRAVQTAKTAFTSLGSSLAAKLPAMPSMPSWSGSGKAEDKKE